ncbi:MAG: immunoglobulin domain-containing protein, partial [Verrucomicrobiae bacterium]|nr:immunoglobulin domain-containing protein [Verrucomicrobiae bacterium]
MQVFLKRLLAIFLLTATLTTLPAAVAPSNDDFANAVILAGADVVVSGSNVDATLEPGEPPTDGGAVQSVWWIWTPPVSGMVEVDTAGSSFDTVLSLYFGSRLSQLALIASDDDGGPDFTSRIRFSTTGGIPIAVRVVGYGGATGAIQLHVRADRGVKIVSQPTDQLVADGGSARFAVGVTGPAPLNYQWLRDGVEIPGATTPILVLTPVTAAQAGRYQVVVRNGFASTISHEARLTVTSPATVVLFNDPQVVDTVNAAPDGQALNFHSNLESLGHDVIPLASLESSPVLQSGVVVALPEMELNDPPPSLGTLLNLFVGNGGTLIVSDNGRWLPLLNSAFSWNLFAIGSFSSGWITGEAAGTPFEDGPEILPLNWSSVALANDTLPAGSRRIYETGWGSLVVVLPYGSGRVIWLGWDWYDGAPRGGQDGGWSPVLAAAVELGRASENVELAPVIVSPPRSHTLLTGETLELSVLAFGSQPLAYQWFRNSEPIPGATGAILSITNITTNLAGSYVVRVSNDLGSTNSAPTEVRVLKSVAIDFQIQFLGSAGEVVEKDWISGDDRGGIAISTARVFATGDGSTGRFDADTLSDGASLGVLYDGLVSDLSAEHA